MSISRSEPMTLAARIWPEHEANRLSRFLALALIGSIALTLAAKWKVPMYPVPMTMQTGAVFLLAAAYGWRLAFASVLLYLIGFALAAALAGWLADRGCTRSPWTALPSFLAADAVIFACGLAWLSASVGWDKALGFGLYPFVYGEALKVGLAAALVVAAWRMVPPEP